MVDGTIIIDTPSGVEAYRILATYHGLKLELRWGPRGAPTRGMALASARRIAASYELPGKVRTRAQALATLQPLYEYLINKDSHEVLPSEGFEVRDTGVVRHHFQ